MRASDRAYKTLRDEILDGVLIPGSTLAEVEQSARLGVSRTPLREAISRLVADGLVASQPGRGSIVTEFSASSIRGLYELREALEQRAAALAALRRDERNFVGFVDGFRNAPALLCEGASGLANYYALIEDFDEAIDTAVNNSYLSSALRSARLHSARIRRLAQHDTERLEAAAREHLLIVEAILDGDSALAAHATAVHLHMSLRHALDTITTRTTEVRPSA